MEPVDEQPRDVRIGKALDEYLRRRARGAAPSIAEFVRGYPDLADELHEALALTQDLRQSSLDPMQLLIRHGVVNISGGSAHALSLGPYVINSCLGAGGMGIVLDAYEPSLDRSVAIKVMRPDLAQDSDISARFEREAKAAAALRHGIQTDRIVSRRTPRVP